LKSTLRILALLSVIPAQAGIQFSSSAFWIPVYTGITIRMIYCLGAHGRPRLNAMRDMSSRVGRPFRKAFTSPEGEGFPPFPKGTLKNPADPVGTGQARRAL
jgi:hypothetical protein